MADYITIKNRISSNSAVSNIDYNYGPWNTIEEACANIPIELRSIGLTVGIGKEDITEYWWKLGLLDKNLIYKGTSSVINNTSNGGFPIYNLEIIDSLGDLVADRYILIEDVDTDLNGEVTNKIYTSKNSSYTDIIFSTLRALQAEVAKMRNSFNYGLYSWTDTNTAMSAATADTTEDADEPLWAVDENGLSEIDGTENIIDLGKMTPAGNVDISTSGSLKITGTALWDYITNTIDTVTDSKLMLYLTTNSTNILLSLPKVGDTTSVIPIDLNNLGIQKAEWYNILIVVSRQLLVTENKETTLKGDNFIWITVNNNANDTTLLEGYYKPSDNSIQASKLTIDALYFISLIVCTDLTLTKCIFYSKYQDFSNTVIPSKPNDDSYKYSVAHITIRSVDSDTVLNSISDLLPNNELIYVVADKALWIKNNYKLIKIGTSGSSDDTGMTTDEMIAKLKEMGIVQDDNGNLELNPVSDITFINNDTGSKYIFKVDAYGKLRSRELVSDTLENRITNSGLLGTATDVTGLSADCRGLIGRLRLAEYNKANNTALLAKTVNIGLYADRIKIGAFYAPLSTDTVHGCTHCFIELENTSDDDFDLEGCYLHFTKPKNSSEQLVYHLALTGVIKAGSTYLIRGAQMAYSTDANVLLDVTDYDLEWYNDGTLLSFELNKTLDLSANGVGYGFALTYGNAELTPTTSLYHVPSESEISSLGITLAKAPYIYDSTFIDAIYYNKAVMPDSSSATGYWAALAVTITLNSFYKNTFELDPAQLAFLSLNLYDSSRARWASTNDILIVTMNKKNISFPHSSYIRPISYYTPKASKDEKNVCTDKTKLDESKPNMLTCSFGIDIYKTRTFNWISAGLFDESLYIRKQGDTAWSSFSSYTTITEEQTLATTYPNRKEFSVEVNNTIYARITGRFPGANSQFASHKCIINVVSADVTTPTVYEYKVVRDSDSTYTSDILTFTLYPNTYVPRIYLTTDQLGFHWIEYQVWSAAANKLLEKIKADLASEHIIPMIFNSGDMTLNGTRINEWLDYYQGGKVLFNQYELMNVVGNNDLCNTDTTILGTGDDIGKSNSFFFHLFFCYEVNTDVFTPIVNGKYVPSLYYFESDNQRFVMVNSEITTTNCSDWFKLKDSSNNTINIYTGYTIGSTTYNSSFTSIYTMVYNMLTTSKEKIVTCHEMPFTVITNACIKTGTEQTSRSINTSNALIGSHLNQISSLDTSKGIYWFSRLLEYKGVKLCLGGHKHTYSCTYPVREYFWFSNGTKNSKDNYSDYTMSSTLENDDVTFINPSNSYDMTKFPLTKREDPGTAVTGFYPCTADSALTGGVTYFMCLATGYKLTSNKELPSANLKFSMLVPNTSVTSAGKDKASNDLKYPMFGIIAFNSTIDVELVRIANILSSYKFNLNTYSSSDMLLLYVTSNTTDNYGTWGTTESKLIQL